MIDQKLLDYISNQSSLGKSREEIEKVLVDSGWPPETIQKAFLEIKSPDPTSSPQSPSQPTATSLPKAAILFNQAFKIYSQRWKTILGVVLLPNLVILLIGGLGALGFFGLMTLLNIPNFKYFWALIPFFLLIPIAMFTSAIFQFWSQIALILTISQNQKITVKQAYRQARSKILSFWWVSALIGLITMAGFILFIIPGIIFMIWFAFAPFVLVIDHQKGINALLKSREYIKGHVLAVLGRLAVLGIFGLIFYGLISFLTETLEFYPLDIFIGLLSAFFIIPLGTIYSYLIFKGLKSIKGEFKFIASKKAKVILTVVTIIPLLLILGTIIFAISFYNLKDFNSWQESLTPKTFPPPQNQTVPNNFYY